MSLSFLFESVACNLCVEAAKNMRIKKFYYRRTRVVVFEYIQYSS